MNIREGGEPKNIQEKTATTALNALQLFSDRIYVEKTYEQYCLGYHNSQKVKEGV